MKSKFYLTIVLAFFFVSTLIGQTDFRVLFVNDNSVFPPNTDTMLFALTHTGYEYSVFNARDSLRSPTFTELSAYDLVIWYCSSDGVGNYLWNGTDTDNSELAAYLETGGHAWIIGTDFMYDRYAQAPDTFVPGDFVYDYLGTWQYNVQAYADDGGQGVPELDLVAPGFTSLPVLQWSFPTAWYVDGCTPTPDAIPVYQMGPSNYMLAGYSSAIWYGAAGHTALTFFFDPAIMDSFSNRVILLEEILSNFRLYAGLNNEKPESSLLSIYPNPAKEFIQLAFPSAFSGHTLQIQIVDLSGRSVYTGEVIAEKPGTKMDIHSLENGMYILKLTDGTSEVAGRLLVNK